MDIVKELEQYDLKIRESDSPERLPIDFSIEDSEDNVCWAWGDWKSYEVECDHPHQCIDWGDDDECGVCKLCGAECNWHWGYNYDDGYKAAERAIYRWRKSSGGLVKKYIEQIMSN